MKKASALYNTYVEIFVGEALLGLHGGHRNGSEDVFSDRHVPAPTRIFDDHLVAFRSEETCSEYTRCFLC